MNHRKRMNRKAVLAGLLVGVLLISGRFTSPILFVGPIIGLILVSFSVLFPLRSQEYHAIRVIMRSLELQLRDHGMEAGRVYWYSNGHQLVGYEQVQRPMDNFRMYAITDEHRIIIEGFDECAGYGSHE